ncbi:MAG: winged helix-turn-helix domain-containing protein [Myxococcales bacterium]|nr:winged helix-turn-helix domain-containing protein [Myxococcales bacterium]
MLRGQDIVIAIKLCVTSQEDWTYEALATSLNLSPSVCHASLRRLRQVGLVAPDRFSANAAPLLECLVHAVKYFFPVEPGRLTRGIPTSYGASPLRDHLLTGDAPPPVWPHSSGPAQGQELQPLHKCVPRAVATDERLQEVLALVDAIRSGRARERSLAIQFLEKRIQG